MKRDKYNGAKVLSNQMGQNKRVEGKRSIPSVEKMETELLEKLTGSKELTEDERGELQFLVDVKNGEKKLNDSMKRGAGRETMLRFLTVMKKWEKFWQFITSWGEAYTKVMLSTVLEKAVTELAGRDFTKENTFSLTNIVKILAVAGKQQTNATFQININAKTANEVDGAIEDIMGMLRNSPVLLKEIGSLEIGKNGDVKREGESDDVIDVDVRSGG